MELIVNSITLDDLAPGDLILYGENNSSQILWQMALVYRRPTQAELSYASVTVPAVLAAVMSTGSPGVFITGNTDSIPATYLTIVPLEIIAAVYKACSAASDLFASAAPYAVEPWTAGTSAP